jgi:lycopene beta-cyclase
VSDSIDNKSSLWQHFSGIEIETSKDFFDEKIFNLMDFDCDQKDSIHFFYTLPFSKTNALIETTWISDLNNTSLNNYDIQLKDYVENKLKIKNYKINYKEIGAIPLFHPNNIKKLNQIEIGTVGGMTRLSTGYTFLNIQEQSRYIRKNIENIKNTKIFSIERKYEFLDNIFLKVLKNNPNRMAQIFYKIFNGSPNTAINFLSNKSNILEDISIISKMPKFIFLKQLF